MINAGQTSIGTNAERVGLAIRPGRQFTETDTGLTYIANEAGDAWLGPISAHAQTSDDDVANPPTDAEIDAAFGTPAEVIDGFIGLIDDNGAGTTVWLCAALNGKWWYEQLTAAV